MVEFAKVNEAFTLQHYEALHHLAGAVSDLRAEAAALVPLLKGRTVWMINSTGRGGGVAEMLPKMVTLLNELGLPTRWLVIETDRPEFFALTKRIHNMIHGEGHRRLSSADRQLYDAVSQENASKLEPLLGPEDIIVIHDPQPLGVGAILKRELGLMAIWRCHIGLDERLPATRAAWKFLRSYAEVYDHSVFSAPEYIPDYLAGYATVIYPGIDPESHKNRDLPPSKLVGILCNAGLEQESHPVVFPAFLHQAQRLRPDGSFGPAVDGARIGLMYRPIITQVSRWDRLKGFAPLLEAFVRLKQRLKANAKNYDEPHRRRLEIARLALAGPDPASIRDDPEAQAVLDELSAAYRKLPPEYQEDVALLTLPMDSRKENALMVNALQRCSTIVVQNSIREGFGLTATEAMWKRVPVVGTHACGLRQQLRDGIDGLLVRDPEDPEEIADKIDLLLRDARRRDILARNAQRRAHQEFLIFTQMQHWLRLLAECIHEASFSARSHRPASNTPSEP